MLGIAIKEIIDKHEMNELEPDAVPYRYWAFISYSQKDAKWAAWLHKKLETYSGHKKLAGKTNRFGESIPKRLFPVFLDREELEAGDLTERIHEALRESRCLIVICSPNSAESNWVNKEINAFKALGRESRLLTLILAGEPNASDNPAFASSECFPEELRFRLGRKGQLTRERLEPIAADVRPERDGKENAFLKLAAGVLGIRFDELKQRDQQRRIRLLQAIIGLSIAAVAIFASIAWYANNQRMEAEKQRSVAEKRAHIALSRQLATQVFEQKQQMNFDLALLLAAHAYREADTRGAKNALLNLLQSSPIERYLHTDDCWSIAFSPDAKQLASAGSDDGAIIVWDVETGREKYRLENKGKQRVRAIAWSPDGRWLLSGDNNTQIVRWDLQTRSSEIFTDKKYGGIIERIVYNNTGSHFVIATDEHDVEVWSSDIGQSYAGPIKVDSAVSELVFLNDNPVLFIAGHNGILSWRFDSEETKQIMSGYFNGIAVSPDQRYIAITGFRERFSLYEKETDKQIYENPDSSSLDAPEPTIRMTFFPNGKIIAVGHKYGVELRNGVNGELLSVLEHSGFTADLAFSPDGKRLARCGGDKVEIYAVHLLLGGSWLHRQLPGNHRDATSVAFSPEGNTFAIGYEDGSIGLWDTDKLILKRIDNPISRNPIRSLAFHPTLPLIAYGYHDGKIALRDVINQKTKFLNEDMTNMHYVSGLSFSSDGNQLGSVTANGKFLIWDTQTFQLLRGPEVLWSDYSIGPVDVNLPMQKIASPLSYEVRVWDIVPSGMEGPRIFPLPVPKRSGGLLFSQGGESLSISKDGKRIAVAVENTGNIYLLDELDGHPLPTPIIMNRDSWLPKLAFDAAGRRLASVGYSDGTAFILDVNPESWVSIACRIANRSLTEREWQQYIGKEGSPPKCHDG